MRQMAIILQNVLIIIEIGERWGLSSPGFRMGKGWASIIAP
jgi:hypothetical protein